jgi:ISXO2-like transposase domain
VKRGTRLITDGHASYPRLIGYRHDPRIVGKMAGHVALPWTHRAFSLMKRWSLGTYHGLRRKHVDSYLNEFVFRYNRRFHRHVSFETLLGLAAHYEPKNYWDIIKRDNPRKGRQKPATSQNHAPTQPDHYIWKNLRQRDKPRKDIDIVWNNWAAECSHTVKCRHFVPLATNRSNDSDLNVVVDPLAFPQARFQLRRNPLRRPRRSASSANATTCGRGARTVTSLVGGILMTMTYNPHFADHNRINFYRARAESIRTQFAGGSLPG